MEIKVIETFELKFCCVCTANHVANGEIPYLNVFENAIMFQTSYVSLAEIIDEILGLTVRINLPE
jgi:hypothetical protein